MTTLVRSNENQTPTERVKPGDRPTSPALTVQIEGKSHATGTIAVVVPPHHGPAHDQASNPTRRRVGAWAASLVKLFSPPSTQRARTRQEAYQERLKGYGLNRISYPRC